MGPEYLHDCDRCRYIKTVEFRDDIYDLYECENTYLARYSNEPSEYYSFYKPAIKGFRSKVNGFKELVEEFFN